MLEKGDKVAHYVVEHMLGKGGMGAVYLAVDERLGRRVALKVILESERAEETREGAARLLREARAAASLTHPNVVSVFDVGEHEGRVYLAMEYVVGKTLREMMDEPDIPWQKRLRWLVDAARALAAAHRSGLVHRDIKPENVMVRDDGLVKVLDFGIARRLGPVIAPGAEGVDPVARTELANVATLTGKGVVIGTPMYMAPEQLKGGAPDPRTDQFAWGVLCFEVLSGERPWPQKSDLLAAVATILTEPPESLRKRVPEVPPAVEATVARALSRNPSERFESMDDIADALDALATRSGQTGSGELTARARPARKEEPAAGGDTRPSTPAVEAKAEPKERPSVTSGQAMVTAKSPEHPLAPPPQRLPRRRRWHFVLGVAVTLAGVGVWYKFFRRPPVVVARPVVDAGSVVAPSVSAGPVSDNAAASAAYLEGIQHWRDGAEGRSRESLQRAIALDPGLAAAHLFLALQALHGDPSEAQAQYQKAFLYRSRLDTRDAALLDVLDPLVRASADLGDAEARLTKVTRKMPKDPLFLYLLGYVRQGRSDFEKARDAYEDAIHLDAAFMPAWRAKGDVLRLLGNVDGALEAYDHCIKASPAATTCLQQRILLLRDRGECDRMEQDARAWQAVEPASADASYYVAAALMARGQPEEAVRVALKRQWDAMPVADRDAGEAQDLANLALYGGDFATAAKETRAWERAISEQAVMLHAGPRHQLALIAYETGEMQDAAKTAADFLKIVPALTPDPMGNDPTIWADEYLYRGNMISKDELEKRRATWLRQQESSRTQQENLRMAPFRWVMLYAGFSENQDEAKEALDKLPDFLPLPPDARRTATFNADVGKVDALAGKYDEAIPSLRAVTGACIALGEPQLQTRAFYFLGLALEGKGDLEGARKAYQVVVDRWGNAKPRSTTAEAAKARLKQLE